jgi:hypothetical protein
MAVLIVALAVFWSDFVMGFVKTVDALKALWNWAGTRLRETRRMSSKSVVFGLLLVVAVIIGEAYCCMDKGHLSTSRMETVCRGNSLYFSSAFGFASTIIFILSLLWLESKRLQGRVNYGSRIKGGFRRFFIFIVSSGATAYFVQGTFSSFTNLTHGLFLPTFGWCIVTVTMFTYVTTNNSESIQWINWEWLKNLVNITTNIEPFWHPLFWLTCIFLSFLSFNDQTTILAGFLSGSVNILIDRFLVGFKLNLLAHHEYDTMFPSRNRNKERYNFRKRTMTARQSANAARAWVQQSWRWKSDVIPICIAAYILLIKSLGYVGACVWVIILFCTTIILVRLFMLWHDFHEVANIGHQPEDGDNQDEDDNDSDFDPNQPEDGDNQDDNDYDHDQDSEDNEGDPDLDDTSSDESNGPGRGPTSPAQLINANKVSLEQLQLWRSRTGLPAPGSAAGPGDNNHPPATPPPHQIQQVPVVDVVGEN